MRVAVLPNRVQAAGIPIDARISLFEPPEGAAVGSVGTQVIRETLRTLGRTPSPKAWDFAALAMAVIAADRHINRATVSEDGWTRQIHLTVAVTDADHWASLRDHIQGMLRFLTGDVWTLAFVPDGVHPAPPRHAVGRRPETCVSLLSGGLDSLIGAIDLNAVDHLPMFVSNRVKGDCSKQNAFAAAVGAEYRILSLNHNARTNVPNPEISQRPRSLAFLSFGVLAATTLDTYQAGATIDLYVPENGFISLNVPLTPLRMGSLSTRTTHPRFMAAMQDLLQALGLRVRLVNPYRHKTKGEMMVECADQALLTRLAPESMSCGRSGRINRHCGKCLPCLVRRAAFLRHTGTLSGDRTTPAYKNPDPPGAFTHPAFSRYDDVMQCLAAIDMMDRLSARRWIGSAITASKVPDPEPFRDVAARGLVEIKDFLREAGLV
ncbi:Qat anti-phage system QueC-like protein QatC [Microvirga massiliensis]|uniref:Qat anti-phage system QueC-like protein QatC n=1 Tax=Microvirga massiliensis TaxID=1033741 RepID=UPI00062BC784|nr:Qat anti-phage system QueC-like protein QatC [Microvirga massiliensis]